MYIHELTNAWFARRQTNDDDDDDDQDVEVQAPCPACGASVESVAHSTL